MKKQIGLFLLTIVCVCLGTLPIAGAAYKSIDDSSPYVFMVPAGGIIAPCGADFNYGYAETYTPTSSSIKYTAHEAYCYVNDWQHGLYASVEIYNAHEAKYYDKSGSYIKSATMKRYNGDIIISKYWAPYEKATGSDIATVNTNPSSAKATFTVFCKNAVVPSHSVTAELSCS